MCGIVGIAGRIEGMSDMLTAQCDTMSHRGPDAQGEWRSEDRKVALGHRRLSVIDLSPGGSQPMSTPDGDLRVVLNGEIYNYRVLRKTLESLGHQFRSASDTEVLLEAFREWGPECLPRVNGMFAFAIYDAKKRRLFLARDRAGEKPLFYQKVAGRLAFASELKALMANPALERRVNPEALDHFIAYGYIPGELCLLEGANKLPPAHCLTYDLDTDQLKRWCYWKLPEGDAIKGADVGEIVAELDALLSDSVRMQLVADVPVGILLSGGLDSSLITAIAAKVAAGTISTFTIAFPGSGVYDETLHARIVASHFGTRHTELVAEPATVDLLPELARQFDEPLGDSSMVPTLLVSKLVRESCTVALGGDGGDELFGGYLHYSRVQNQHRLRRLMPGVIKRAVGKTARLLPTGVRGRTYLRGLEAPDDVAWIRATLLFDGQVRRRLAPATRTLSGFPPESYRLAAGGSGGTLLRTMTTADFRTYLPDDILVKVDRASMLASLEMRAPFLDKRVIEFAFGKVPDNLRATRYDRKVVLRLLGKQLLPARLDLRRKQGFSIPLDKWFKGRWGGYLRDVLLSAPPALYNPTEIRDLIRGQMRGFANGQRLFNLAILELWRREYNIQIG